MLAWEIRSPAGPEPSNGIGFKIASRIILTCAVPLSGGRTVSRSRCGSDEAAQLTLPQTRSLCGTSQVPKESSIRYGCCNQKYQVFDLFEGLIKEQSSLTYELRKRLFIRFLSRGVSLKSSLEARVGHGRDDDASVLRDFTVRCSDIAGRDASDAMAFRRECESATHKVRIVVSISRYSGSCGNIGNCFKTHFML